MPPWKALLVLPSLLLLCNHYVDAAAIPCASGKAGSFDCKSITMQANISLNGFRSTPTSASNLWGYADPDDGREYAIIGLS
ncbi:MAG TPA: hypothetical protein VLH08_08480, partial [Acidobacteriota bacterium]|nr:hypothetical protein [Acidobacteriota bacterium]